MTNNPPGSTPLPVAVVQLCAARPGVATPGSVHTVTGSFGSTHTVEAGLIDDRARTAFAQGQCHALAFAMAEATGFELVWIGRPECSYDPDCGPWWERFEGERDWCECQVEHIAVRDPDGVIWDIDGPNLAHVVFPVDDAVADWVLSDSTWRYPEIELARSFVGPLLELH